MRPLAGIATLTPPQDPLVAVPSAVSVVFMALGGALLAVIWRNIPIPATDKDDFVE